MFGATLRPLAAVLIVGAAEGTVSAQVRVWTGGGFPNAGNTATALYPFGPYAYTGFGYPGVFAGAGVPPPGFGYLNYGNSVTSGYAGPSLARGTSLYTGGYEAYRGSPPIANVPAPTPVILIPPTRVPVRRFR